MKSNITTIFLLLVSCSIFGQTIFSHDFEDENGNPDLGNWVSQCVDEVTVPHDDGWALRLSSGNFQGCFPAHAYTTIDWEVETVEVSISGLAKIDSQYKPWGGGATISLALIDDEGGFIIIATDTVFSTEWTEVSFNTGVVNIAEDSEPILLLEAGYTSGPGLGYVYFDDIIIEKTTETNTSTVNNKQVFEVYPNPAINHLTIDFETNNMDYYNVNIYNLLGKLVKSIQDISYFPFEVSTEDLSSGTYFVSLESENRQSVKRISIKNTP